MNEKITNTPAQDARIKELEEVLVFVRDFKITNGDGGEVPEDSLHKVRKIASRALSKTEAR